MKPLSVRDILRIHDMVVQATGGSLGLREPGLLEAIVEKPQASFGGEDLYPSVIDKAAALFESLCNYHVFVDGNKRTAITTLEYFLHLNGLQLSADAKTKEDFTLNTATSHPDLSIMADWIKSNSHEEPPS